MERGSSEVECRTRNQVNPGSNPPLLEFRRLGVFILYWPPSWLICINEYLAIDSGGNVSDLVVARNCCLARMLPGEAELVSEWKCLPGGGGKIVKRFERSNGLDTTLYKTTFTFTTHVLTRFWFWMLIFDVLKVLREMRKVPIHICLSLSLEEMYYRNLFQLSGALTQLEPCDINFVENEVCQRIKIQ